MSVAASGYVRNSSTVVKVQLQRADRAEARAEELRCDVEAARHDAEAAWAGLGEAQIQGEAALAEARDAQMAAEALREAEEARKARGRLRRALDGWRGR